MNLGPGVFIAINVEDRQNKEIHSIQKVGHLRITSIGGDSLIMSKIKFRLIDLFNERH